MRKVFQSELEQLGDRIHEMSTLVAEAVDNANTAIETKNLEVAQEVITGDTEIDNIQNTLDEQAIELLALQNPVASDLRTIVGTLRMTASLERMGDLAQHLAQLARLRYPNSVVPTHLTKTFDQMSSIDSKIAHKLTNLFDTLDEKIIEEITDLNEKLNDLHQDVFKALSDPSWSENANTTVDVNLAARYYKRIGDHGVSVANKVNYLITGEWVRGE